MIDRNRYESLADALTEVDDLDRVSRAVEREREIRIGMARTGQGREPVAEFLDAQDAMSQEAVLELTEGQPTTMADALRRYVNHLSCEGESSHELGGVMAELAAIVEYPWPEDERRIALHNPHYGLALHLGEDESGQDLIVSMGNNRWEVARVTWEDAGYSGVQAAREAIQAVYRATLARVIADPDHDVQLGRDDVNRLVMWLTSVPCSGSIILGRVTVDACENGGVIVRTRPYSSGGHYQVAREKDRNAS